MPDSSTAFLFDLDGTLVDSVYEHVLAWHEAGRVHSFETWIDGHYEPRYYQSGYYQPYWVDGYESAC